jgi:RNA polymerase sigma factor (sigma-70 family)
VEAIEQIDKLLVPLLQVTDEAEFQHLLVPLISLHAEPTIKEIIKFKLRVSLSRSGGSRQNQDAEDVYSETIVQILTQLREFKADPAARPINNFRSYVATVTYHVCYEYLRHKYPQRSQLKDKLRYLLSHQEGFALWKSDNEWICGFALWQEQKKAVVRSSKLHQLYDTLLSHNPAGRSDGGPGRNMAEMLANIFNKAENPIELDDLVNLVADLSGVKDQADQPEVGDEETGNFPELADPRARIEEEIDQRNYFKKLWLEISQLRPMQCAALLLNLKDDKGRGVIVLFSLLGIATLDEIAQALAMPADRFAKLWNELPIEDSAIAELLGITRQQVINLRKSARERLGRRMRVFA